VQRGERQQRRLQLARALGEAARGLERRKARARERGRDQLQLDFWGTKSVSLFSRRSNLSSVVVSSR